MTYKEIDTSPEDICISTDTNISLCYDVLTEQTKLFLSENGVEKYCFIVPGKDEDGDRFNLDKIRKLLVQIKTSNSGDIRDDRQNVIVIYEIYQTEPQKKMVLTFLFNGKKIKDVASDDLPQYRVDMASQTEKTLFKICFDRLMAIIRDYFGIESTWKSDHLI